MSESERTLIYVALLDEGVEVWRPVEAIQLGADRYRISSVNENPEHEHWQFQQDETVRCRTRAFAGGTLGLAAFERAWGESRVNTMASSVYETLARLGADRTSGVYLKTACSEAAIRDLQKAALDDLKEAVPESYVRLLRLTNGVQINGAFFKEAENLVLENLDVPHPEVILLGSAGNVAEFVFDRRDRRFHTINMGFPDERLASFETFEELLLTVLKEQQVV